VTYKIKNNLGRPIKDFFIQSKDTDLLSPSPDIVPDAPPATDKTRGVNVWDGNGTPIGFTRTNSDTDSTETQVDLDKEIKDGDTFDIGLRLDGRLTSNRYIIIVPSDSSGYHMGGNQPPSKDPAEVIGDFFKSLIGASVKMGEGVITGVATGAATKAVEGTSTSTGAKPGATKGKSTD
jgi:hypothetical protein